MDRPTILQAIGVRKHFGGLVAVDDVSFRVHEGQCLALIGPNGAGKTTLLNVIAGSLPPTSGTVLLEGRSLNGASPHERARLGIGRTFQQALTFGDMTVLENVMVGCHLQGRSRLIDVAFRLPRMRREEDDIYLEALRYLNLVGLGTHAEEMAGILPFGQQRLLAIARALASKPKVLLLDEPAAGLNRLEKNALVDLIRRLREMEITAILVEHDMEVVMQLAEWIVVLDHGSRLAQGPPDEVRHNPAVIEAYLGVEAA